MNKEQLERYFCTTFLDDIKEEGQTKLLNSKVVVVGLGGLGNHVLPILVTSGVGYLSIIDNDIISRDNLPRQSIFAYKDISKKKTTVMKNKLKSLNPDVTVVSHNVYLCKNNASKLLKGYDLVIDCTDNFDTKFLINDTCKKLNIPFIIGGVSDYKGQVMTCIPNKTSDFKSLFDELSVNIEQKYKDEDRGVFPPAVELIGSVIACESLKYLIGMNDLLINQLLVIDVKKWNIQKIKIEK